MDIDSLQAGCGWPAREAAPVTGVGYVTAIHGSVLDVRFEAGALPAIDDSIEIRLYDSRVLVAEVQ